MCHAEITPRFDQSIVFPDVDAGTLAREDAMGRTTAVSLWQDYLRKVLPPAPQVGRHRMLRLVQF